ASGFASTGSGAAGAAPGRATVESRTTRETAAATERTMRDRAGLTSRGWDVTGAEPNASLRENQNDDSPPFANTPARTSWWVATHSREQSLRPPPPIRARGLLRRRRRVPHASYAPSPGRRGVPGRASARALLEARGGPQQRPRLRGRGARAPQEGRRAGRGPRRAGHVRGGVRHGALLRAPHRGDALRALGPDPPLPRAGAVVLRHAAHRRSPPGRGAGLARQPAAALQGLRGAQRGVARVRVRRAGARRPHGRVHGVPLSGLVSVSPRRSAATRGGFRGRGPLT